MLAALIVIDIVCILAIGYGTGYQAGRVQGLREAASPDPRYGHWSVTSDA